MQLHDHCSQQSLYLFPLSRSQTLAALQEYVQSYLGPASRVRSLSELGSSSKWNPHLQERSAVRVRGQYWPPAGLALVRLMSSPLCHGQMFLFYHLFFCFLPPMTRGIIKNPSLLPVCRHRPTSASETCKSGITREVLLCYPGKAGEAVQLGLQGGMQIRRAELPPA